MEARDSRSISAAAPSAITLDSHPSAPWNMKPITTTPIMTTEMCRSRLSLM